MPNEKVERKLAAILAADVAGYSRMTGLDEEGTHVRLKEHLRALVDPKIAEHHGRVVKNTGDGLLAEFASVVDAVRCAVDVQHRMIERNSDVPSNERMEFRVGINVGDVISDSGDLFGDGVNVATRLEGLADPGGFAFPGVSTSTLAECATSALKMSASSRLRTSRGRCVSTACGSVKKPQAPRDRLFGNLTNDRRSPCFRF
jgi:class 3 adenylate cyclase